MKAWWLSLVLLGGMQSSMANPNYNIAQGLAPTVQGQSIRSLQNFDGEFRIWARSAINMMHKLNFRQLTMQ